MLTHRKVVKIDEEKCNGCGQCVPACAEGAIQIMEGKARLVSEVYCDGLGDCLGECPQGAITIEEREAEEFDEVRAEAHVQQLMEKERELPCGCPSTMVREIDRQSTAADHVSSGTASSELTNWPVQLRLVPPIAPYFQDADLLLIADCVPFVLPNFHADLLHGKTAIVGCPKFDDVDYYIEKLADIFKHSSINSLTVAHMEVPCCSGLDYIATRAIEASGKDIPVNDVMITIQGEIMVNVPSSD